MKAIVLKEFGGTENLEVQELPIPTVSESEVLVKVKSLSINPVDVKTRAGKGMAGRMKELKPLILGWDVSGVVEVVGASVQGFKKGDEVFGMVNFPGHGQAYAEYVLAPESHLALKPAQISHEAAAAATLAALTAWQVLVTHAEIKKGDRVLIHAAAGGVGHYAVQIAKHLGAYVIGTSSQANKDFVLSIGADEHIDYKNQVLEEAVKDVDFVLDTLGGDTIDHSLEVIKKGGALISIPSGLNQAVVDKAHAKGIRGSFMLVQSSGQDQTALAELLAKGTIKSEVAQVYSFANMAQAHAHVETARTRGKVIVNL